MDSPTETGRDRRSSSPIAVRPARPADRAFVRATAIRLADFSLPSWREAGEIVSGEMRTIDEYFRGTLPGAAMLIAEADRQPLGFAFLETGRDYFNRREHAHVGILAVAADAEGLGVGRALIAAAEEWTRLRGLGTLTLNVFERNARARRIYERAGFTAETLRYRKDV
jgi:GNAT superfamily N-acetyltransferase